MSNQNPYAAPRASLGDYVGTTETAQLAGRGQRLGARILDQFIYLVAVSPGFVLALEMGSEALSTSAIGAAALAGVLFVAVLGINLRMLAERGQTIGNRVVGVRIVRLDGGDMSLGRIIGLRIIPVSLLSLIPMIGGIAGLADSPFIFRDDRRCIHDLFAESKVVLVP
jgi:uncharacterized RDD family membrane protein YckC